MRRILLFAAAVVLVAIALIAFVVALLPREALKARIGQEIASWTGRAVSLRGEPEIDLFPRLSVTLNDVHVGGPEGMDDAQILSMDRLTGTIRLLPLLIGRVEIGAFTMERPLVRLVRDGDGQRNWTFDSGAAALQLAFAGDVPLGDFSLEGGTVIYEDRQTGDTERLDSVNLAVDWTSVRQPIEVEGSAIWRGEQVNFSGGAPAPFALINGAGTAIEARIDSAPIAMLFTGSAQDYPQLTLTGALKLSTPSLRRFASWLGNPIGPGSTLGQASLFGTATFADGILSVDGAELALDGNNASGAVKIEIAARPTITGTLAFGGLDLTPYFGGLSTALSTAADWRRVPLPTDWFADIDADIRLSADRVVLGGLTTGATAASASLRGGRLEIGLARAAIEDGSITGDFAVVNSAAAPGVEIEAQLRAADIPFAGAAPMLGLREPMAGIASAAVDVTTGGTDLGALLAGLSGTARVSIKDGSVPLFGVDELATGRPSGDAVTEPGLSSVPVDAANLGMSLGGGVAIVERASIETPAYVADMQGWVGLRDGSLGINGTIMLGASGPEGAAASLPAPPSLTETLVADGLALPQADPGIPFAIEGTLAHPVARSTASPSSGPSPN